MAEYDPTKPAKPALAPISQEPDLPPLEITAPILPAPPKPPGWAPGGFDLAAPSQPSHIAVQAPVRPQQAPRPNEPGVGGALPAPAPADPYPPQGPSNWPIGDHAVDAPGGWIDVQGSKGR